MKKSLIALAALAATGAFAQSSVTLYGTLDMGFGTINHAAGVDAYNSAAAGVQPTNGTSVAKGAVTGLMGNNTVASRWGIKGVEDMGGGLKANFTLESAVQVASGAVPNGKVNDSMPNTNSTTMINGEGSYTGALFEREATLGLEGGFGSVKLGRQLTVNADAVGAYDPMRAGFAVSPLGFNGGYSGGGFTGEARWDSSLKYAYAMNNGLTFKFGYKNGLQPGNTDVGRGLAASAEYNQGPWGMILSAVQNKDAMLFSNGGGTVATTATPSANVYVPGLAAKVADTDAFTLGFRLTQGALTYKAGYEQIKFKNPSNSYYAGVTSFSAYGIPVNTIVTNGYDDQLTQKVYWIGANWQVSAPLELSAAYYNRKDDRAIAGNVGDAKYTSFMANYALSKRTKLYATANFTKVTGTAWGGAPNLNVFTTGVVHSF